MELPYGEIKDTKLVMKFSTADYSIASVMDAVRERLDLFAQLEVVFLGASTDMPVGPSPIFVPVPIVAHFIYKGKGDTRSILEKVYEVMWEGIAYTFPDEPTWASAKSNYADFIDAQAQLLRARIEATEE
jgi:hypothetical protein